LPIFDLTRLIATSAANSAMFFYKFNKLTNIKRWERISW